MRLHTSLFGAIALSTALILSLAGCSGTPESGSDPNETAALVGADYNPQPRDALQSGGEVNFGLQTLPTQMNDANSDANAYTAQLAAWFRPQNPPHEPRG